MYVMDGPEATLDGIDIETNDFLCTSCSNKAYLSPEDCIRVMKLGEDLQLRNGDVGHPGKNAVNDDIRQSNITFLHPSEDTRWIFEKVMATVNAANQYYKYDIVGIEPMQIAKYSGGGFYDWHMDVGKGVTSRRKLSVSVELSSPDEYKGGALFFKNQDGFKQIKDIGSATIFPSYLMHRVTPVTEGVRWSLVAWVFGKPFR